jgi:hypothetical protein
MHTLITAQTMAALLMCGGIASAQQTTTSPPPDSAAARAPVSTAPSAATETTSATVSMGAPDSLDLPAPETTTSPINRPLMVTSVILLGGTYTASAIDADVSSRYVDQHNLYYPIVGPWMDYANRGGCPVAGSCTAETGNKALLILDGIGQGLGAIGIVTSLFLPEKSTRHWFLIGNSGVHAAPSLVGTGYGLGAGGVF